MRQQQSTNGHAVTLSNRMFSLLEEAYSSGGLTMERISEISQLTAGAVMKRKYFVWNDRHKKFMLSPDGEKTRDGFFNTKIDRMHADGPFGKWVIKYGVGKHGYDQRRSTAA